MAHLRRLPGWLLTVAPLVLLALLALLVLLAGCAQPALRPETPGAYWQGRLSLRIDSQPPQSVAVDFELQGNARQGALLLTGPLGQAVARLDWRPGRASLQDLQGERQYDSLDALVVQATGTSLPVSALFEWLAGRDTLAGGWQADLSRVPEGRLSAQRLAPEPRAELRLVFEPPSR